jgi:hypothetical protein
MPFAPSTVPAMWTQNAPLYEEGVHLGWAVTPRGCVVNRWSSRDHPADGSHQLLGLFVRIGRATLSLQEAVADMPVKESERDLVEGSK